MKRLLSLCISITLLSMIPPPNMQAQGPGKENGFDRLKPAVGELLPNVTAFDAKGKKLALKQLRGQYTVLVFGCLT